MKITKVCCQGCGANLEVGDSIRFVTCNYCHTQLEVVHDATVTHTRLLDKIERTTERMAGNLKVIELQNDLERLDREWEGQRAGLMVRGKDGHVSEPSASGGIIAGAIAAVAGIIWTIFAASMGAPAIFPLFGIGFACFAIFGAFSTAGKAERFRKERDHYETARRTLVSRLDSERRD